MRRAVFAKALALWLAILLLAILNGLLRENALIPSLGTFAGLVASGIILSTCIFLVALAAVPLYGPLPANQWWAVGAFWFVLTLAFEFAFGLVQQKPWSEILQAYTFKGGNIWPLVLVVVLVSPRLAARLRGAP